MSQRTITDEDEGKRVVNADGDEVGIVSTVRNGVAYVDPDPGIGEKLTSKLGWGDVDQEDYPLEQSEVDAVTDREIRIRRNP